MNINIQQIKIEFNVTPEIKRYVYIYLIVGEHCYLIDSGVAGAELEVEKYLHGLGKSITDIQGIFLTHAHPDHIGGAAKIKEKSGCKVYASRGEADWIEDIDKQFAKRPIPNFYSLVNESVKLDGILQDGDVLEPEPGITLQVVGTPGHSCDQLSYLLKEKHCVFVGDSIPVKEDIPIWINERESMESLRKLASMKDVDTIYPAWDKTYEKGQITYKINEALELIRTLKENVNKSKMQATEIEKIAELVCEKMGTPEFLKNPLFCKTVESMMLE